MVPPSPQAVAASTLETAAPQTVRGAGPLGNMRANRLHPGARARHRFTAMTAASRLTWHPCLRGLRLGAYSTGRGLAVAGRITLAGHRAAQLAATIQPVANPTHSNSVRETSALVMTTVRGPSPDRCRAEYALGGFLP